MTNKYDAQLFISIDESNIMNWIDPENNEFNWIWKKVWNITQFVKIICIRSQQINALKLVIKITN